MHHSLSLWSAICININIMLGTGLFINTIYLARMAGAWGALSYGLVGLILLPLIITIARLMELHPQGGFYGFGLHEINPWAGFVSAWVYFAGKLASATLMVHVSTTLFRALIPALTMVPHLLLDLLILSLFALLNGGNVRLNAAMQNFFFGIKMVPIVAIIGIAAFFFSITLPSAPITFDLFSSLIGTIPLVLYATIGFESACSLSSRLHNARINGPRAILISYGSLIIIYCLFQAALYSVCGTHLATLGSFAEVFEVVALYIPPTLQQFFASLLSLCVACSALGGAYGILFANMWNLHALAEHNHVWGSDLFKYMSIHKVPVWCVAAELAICCSYLVICTGTQLPLQQISGLGSVIAYAVSIIAAYYAKQRGALRLSWPMLCIAFVNCMMLATLCIMQLMQGGSLALYFFIFLIVCGLGMFWSQKFYHAQS